MKKQSRSRKAFIAATITATIAAAVFSPIGVSASFKDVSASYKEAVQFLASKGVQGFSSTEFGVSQPIKRVDAAVMLAKVLNLAIYDVPKSGFTDVPSRAAGYVDTLKAEGVISGVSPTKFNANSYITRGEIALMIQRAYGLPGDADHKFTDVSSTFGQAVGALYNFNVTKGISSKHFGTNQPVTRGDFANMLHRASEIDPSELGSVSNPSTFSMTKAEYISDTEVEVTFSKAIDSAKASNFKIAGLTVSKVRSSGDKKTATLTVKNMEYGVNYTVKAIDIKINKQVQKDVSTSFRSGEAPSAVKITAATYVSKNEVELELSRTVDSVKASNFAIAGLTVSKAKLGANKKNVTLTVKNMAYDKTYTVQALGLKINKQMQADTSYSFKSAAAPASVVMTDIAYITRNQIEVTFSKAVDSVRASNFKIDGIAITAAKLSKDKKSATLTLKTLEYGRWYNLQMRDVQVDGDLQSSSTRGFWSETYTTGLDVTATKYVSQTQVNMTFSKALDNVKPENFSINGATVTGAKLSKDKKTVTLTLEGLDYSRYYAIQAIDLQINQVTQRVQYGYFWSAALDDVWGVDITSKKPKVMDNKTTEVEVTFQIMNKQTRKVEKKANGIVLDISTDAGEFTAEGLAVSKVTTKSGSAKLTLTVPASESDIKATIIAKVKETPDAYDPLLVVKEGLLELPIKAAIATSSFQISNVRGFLNGSKEDTVEITFTEGVQIHDGKNNAADLSRYTVNGRKLDEKSVMVTVADEVIENNPTGSAVNKGYKTIILILPDKTLRGDYNNIVSVDQKLLSFGYTLISGNTARAFVGENNVTNDSINEAGVSTGEVNVVQDRNIASLGPSEGTRIVNGNVTISGNNQVGDNSKLYLENLDIKGDLIITSPIRELDLAASVHVEGEIKIQSDKTMKVTNRGNIGTIVVDSADDSITDGIEIHNETDGDVQIVRLNTTRPVQLKGIFESLDIVKPTTVTSEVENVIEKGIINTEGTVILNGSYRNLEIQKAFKVQATQPVTEILLKTSGIVDFSGEVENIKVEDSLDPSSGDTTSLFTNNPVSTIVIHTEKAVHLAGQYTEGYLKNARELKIEEGSQLDTLSIDEAGAFTLKGAFNDVTVTKSIELNNAGSIEQVEIDTLGPVMLNGNAYKSIFIGVDTLLNISAAIERMTVEAIAEVNGTGEITTIDGTAVRLLTGDNPSVIGHLESLRTGNND